MSPRKGASAPPGGRTTVPGLFSLFFVLMPIVSAQDESLPSRVSLLGLGRSVTEIAGDAASGITAFAPAGDVDGDGKGDLLIRFSPRDRIDVEQDRVVLLYGGFQLGTKLDALAPTVRATVIETHGTPLQIDEQRRGLTGVAGGRDVNGDGTPDLLVASPLETSLGIGSHSVLLIYGSGALPERPDLLDRSRIGEEIPGSFFIDDERTDFLGEVVQLCNDLNGDGLAEILFAITNLRFGHAGRITIVFGSHELPRINDLGTLGEVKSFEIEGRTSIEAVSSLGDVDGDGFGDLGVSFAPFNRTTDYPTSYIIFGAESFPAVLEADDLVFPRALELSSFTAIAGAGDVDGDGYADVLFEFADRAPLAPGRGYLLRGGPRNEFPASIEPGSFLGDALGTVIEAPLDIGSAGGSGTTQPRFTFAGGRDLDGDGLSENLLGIATRHVELGPLVLARAGAAYFVRGGEFPARVETGELALGFGTEILGAEPQGRLGLRLALPGDLDGDGQEELLLASGNDACEHAESQTDLKLWIVSGEVLVPQEPELGAIFPEIGVTDGGDRSVVLGNDFTPSMRVFYGEKEASSVAVLASGVAIVESPPRELPGAVELRIEPTNGGRSEVLPFEYRRGEVIRISEASGRTRLFRHRERPPIALQGGTTGDFDGDGLPDVAMADVRTDPLEVHLHLVFGDGLRAPNADLETPVLGEAAVIATPSEAFTQEALFGGSGDIDGDGFDDLLLRVEVDSATHEFWVVRGRSSFPVESELSALDGTLRFVSRAGNIRSGAGAIVPDVSGNGTSDLLLCGIRGDRTLLFLIEGDPRLAESEVIFLEDIASESLGSILEADVDLADLAGYAGDFNGDGRGDFYFGGSGVLQSGAVAILYGNPILFRGTESVLRGSFFQDLGGLLVAGSTSFAGLDLSVAAPGDMDGDGDEELFFGQSDYNSCTLASRAGRGVLLDRDAALVRANPAEPPSTSSLWGGRFTGPPDVFLPSESEPGEGFLWLENHVGAEAFGRSSAAAGDFDADGLPDLLVGAPGSSALTPVPGASYVVRGAAGLLDSERMDFPHSGPGAIRLIEAPPRMGLGRLLAGGFDWDGDGAGDVLVSNDASTVYLVFGGARKAGEFVRGDANGDGGFDLSDAVFLLSYLFLGGPHPPCEDAADADDAGTLEITDAIYILGHLFLGAPAPRPPFPKPGTDPTPDGLEDC